MLDEHLGYVADATRLDLFKTALAKAISPGDTVADLGCGSGILGLLCLQAGAGKIYAIDDSAMLEVARETFERAGLGDRVACLRGKSGRIELPERVDAVVCDHVGYFGFDYGLIEFLADARRRFLKPGGRLMPSRLRLHAAAVGSQKCAELARGWLAEAIPPEFHWLNGHALNAKHAVNLAREDVLGPPAVLGEIDLHADNPEFHSWNAEVRSGRAGVVNGIAGWFECELAEGVWMTNSPLAEKPIQRSQAFLPIGEAVPVREGELVRMAVMARPAEHVIAWSVEFPAAGRRFDHSTWQGMLLSPEELLRANPEHVPRASREGRARMTVLGYCDGRRSAREIEQAVLRDHPDLLPSPAEISHFVFQVLGRDAQ